MRPDEGDGDGDGCGGDSGGGDGGGGRLFAGVRFALHGFDAAAEAQVRIPASFSERLRVVYFWKDDQSTTPLVFGFECALNRRCAPSCWAAAESTLVGTALAIDAPTLSWTSRPYM
jgi:hypothetical protein